jgi:hypothetical protein
MPLPPDVDYRNRVGDSPRFMIPATAGVEAAEVVATVIGPDGNVHPVGLIKFEPGSPAHGSQPPVPDRWSVLVSTFLTEGRYSIKIGEKAPGVESLAAAILVRPDNRVAAVPAVEEG